MTGTIRRELFIPHTPDQVWQAVATSAALAEWMFPNDFVPSVGHHFTFHVPANPAVKFEGLAVHCEVLTCNPPGVDTFGRLIFSWSAGVLLNTRVSFCLEPYDGGTRLLFEHSGFDVSAPRGNQAFKGAEYGWAKMLTHLTVVAERAGDRSNSQAKGS